MEAQKCRVCGCTEEDCSQCVKLTGHPCHWIETDLCSACDDAIKSQTKITDMTFFQNLADLGQVDVSLRILQKNEKLTVEVMPGISSDKFKPILVTGTPAELDEGFFSVILPALDEIKGLQTNIAQVKEQIQSDAAASTAKGGPNKPSPKKSPAQKGALKKSAVKKAAKKGASSVKKKDASVKQTPLLKTDKPAEPNLFQE